MIIRLLLVAIVAGLLVWPIYHFLLKRFIRAKNELEDTSDDVGDRLEELRQQESKLKFDCKEEEKEAQRRAKKAQKVRSKLS